MKKFYKISAAIALGLGAFSSSSLNAQVSIIAMDALYYPGGVSNNGVVGIHMGPAVYKWDPTNGLQLIGQVTTGNTAGQGKVSMDGTKIASTMYNPSSGLNEMALYDIPTSTWSFKGGIGGSSDGFSSSSWGFSSDGTTIVGLGWVNAGTAHGIKWDATNGMVDMGSTVDGRSSRANAINDDKSVIVGWQDESNGSRRGVRWVNGVQEFLKDTSNNNIGEASVLSSDGKTIVGTNGLYPYVWNETTGYQDITHPNSGTFYRGGGTGISGDGKTVIGYFRAWPGGPLTGEGFIWTAEGGRKNLNDYVTSLGIDTKGITFSLPLAISKDGTKIAGTGMIPATNKVAAFYIDLTNYLATSQTATKQISIYPNPVKDILNISGANKIEHIAIYNLAGQKLNSFKGNSTIDVSTLAKGIYLVQITSNGKTQTTKFIKE